MNLEIEVQIPQATDIETISDVVEISADPDGAQVLLVATPGPPGPPGIPGEGGDLSPEERAALIDDASAQTLEDLEPPVSLVLLFENALA
ncbi:hypothetical protein [Nocardia brasiliensis]|uniref:hypothetical protein n=1 Tax=Nocardia brasiliensis TaxID=37326 RepID=UPI0024560DFB|nr:hypothetical protein [Nocardia brasiliensis]